MSARPSVGLGVLIINKNNEVLLGKRKGAHGEFTYAPPGGHLEFGESFENGTIREALEETGLKVENPQFIAVTNDFFEKDNKHYISIFMRVTYPKNQRVINLEPHKVEQWEWFSLDALSKLELFLPLKQLICGKGYGLPQIFQKLLTEDEILY